jgi:hypothetical protein
MAKIRDQILDLHAKAYTSSEILHELKDRKIPVSKAYIQQVLALKAGDSAHFRRTELIYEMNLEILALLRSLVQMKRSKLDAIMARMEVREQPPMDVHEIPHSTESGGRETDL